MFRFAVFAALITLSVATEFDHCGHEVPVPDAVRIKGCEELPCRAIKGEEAYMQVDFTAANPATTLNTDVNIEVSGWSFDYELPEEKRNVCKNLIGGASCPLAAKEKGTYELSFPVDKDLPTINAVLTFKILDENRDMVACFGIRTRVVDA